MNVREYLEEIFVDTNRLILDECPDKLIGLLHSLVDRCQKIFQEEEKIKFKNYHNALIQYLELNQFMKINDLFSTSHRFIIEKNDDYILKIECLDKKVSTRKIAKAVYKVFHEDSFVTRIEKEERYISLDKLKEINAKSEKEIRTAAIKSLENEIETLKQINNDPLTVTHTGYIQFVFENNYYYFSTDNNQFFPFHYIKTPIKNNKYSADACCMEDKKEWLYDCFLSWNCRDSDIKEGANLIFNMLCNAPYSEIIRDGRRQRVQNVYNSGYHYETVYTPERIAEIDF